MNREYLPDAVLPTSSPHQGNQPAATRDLEFSEDDVQVLFYHGHAYSGIVGNFLRCHAMTTSSGRVADLLARNWWVGASLAAMFFGSDPLHFGQGLPGVAQVWSVKCGFCRFA